MPRPVLRRVALIGPRAAEYGLPEPFHRVGVPEAGEDLARPLHARHGGDAPLVAVLHLVADGLRDGVARPLRRGALFLVYPGEAVGVGALEIEHDGQAVRAMAQARELPGLDGAQARGVHVFVVQLREGLVFPLHLDLGRPRAVALLGEGEGELRLVEPGAYDDALAGPYPAAGDGDEAGVTAQTLRIHSIPPG